MAKNKVLLSSLKKVGLNPEGTEGDMEVDEATIPSEAVSTKVAQLQSHYDALAATLDPESNSLKELKKELEAAKKQTGLTAKSKTLKDLTAAENQLNSHLDAVEGDQQKTLLAHEATLEAFKKAVTDHEESFGQRSSGLCEFSQSPNVCHDQACISI